MRHPIASPLLMIAALMLSAAGRLCAQESRGDTLSHATVCARSASTVRGGAHGQPYYNAVADLATCPSEGSATLAQAWRATPSDSVAVRVLGDVTPRLRDQDLFQAVLDAFRDPGRGQSVRLAALQTLVGYYKPGLSVRYTDPGPATGSGSAYVMLGQGDPSLGRNGRKPLAGSARHEILESLASVSAADPDKRVSLIAGYVRERLSKTE